MGLRATLTRLDVEHNDISVFPLSIDQLDGLKTFGIEGNLLPNPPIDAESIMVELTFYARLARKVCGRSPPERPARPAAPRWLPPALHDGGRFIPPLPYTHACPICASPPAALRAYVGGRWVGCAQAMTFSREARLVLLGDTLAGKTSLLRGVARDVPTPAPTGAPDGEDVTGALEVSSMLFLDMNAANDGDDDEPLTITCWDLGGERLLSSLQVAILRD